MEVFLMTKRVMLATIASMVLSTAAFGKNLEFFGSKHDNLQVLSSVVGQEHVPAFLGLSDQKITQFLEQQGAGTFALWKKFTTNQSKSIKQLKNGSCSLIEQISANIKQVFSAADPESLLDTKTLAWLTQIKNKNGYLMVRSTGAEDSATCANAGGNESIAYVKPEPRSVVDAIGSVIASYFGSQSFKNRLNAGEDIFAEIPPMPVLLQELIGETVDGALKETGIPVSGVMFTNEPLYTGTEKFHVTRINSSYGHGEGVVANLVPTDTFMISPSLRNKSLQTQSVIAQKRARIIPNKDGKQYKLVSIDNNTTIANRASLSTQSLQTLYDLGRKIERHYQQATDVEFVVLNGAVYLVQARPVIRTQATPSYLNKAAIDKLTSNPIQEEVDFSTIVPAGSKLLTLFKSSDILIEQNIETAEQNYKPHHKLVIVAIPAAANSHPAVNFATINVPVIFVPEFEQVKTLIKNVDSSNLCICDMQRNTLYAWNNSIKQFNEKPFVYQGWYSHPMPLQLSLSTKKTTVTYLPPKKYSLKEDALHAIETLKYSINGADLQYTLKNAKHFYAQPVKKTKVTLLRKAKTLIAKANSYVEKRWNSYFHPLPIKLSTTSLNPCSSFTPQQKRSLDTDTLNILETLKFSTNKVELQNALKSVIHLFAQPINQTKTLLRAFAQISRKKGMIDGLPMIIHNSKQTLSILESLQEKAEITIKDLFYAVNKPAGSLERLYTIRTLEALLGQQPTEQENILAAYSLLTFKPEEYLFTQASRYRSKLNIADPEFATEALFADCSFCSETDNLWLDFLAGIEPSQNVDISSTECLELKEMLSMINDFGAIPVWLETEFIQAVKPSTTETVTVEDILDPFCNCITEQRTETKMVLLPEPTKKEALSQLLKLNDNKALLAEFKSIQNQLLSIYENSDRFSHAKEFDKAWNEIEAIISTVTSKHFLTSIKNGSDVITFCATNIMQNLIKSIDAAIKAMKVSEEFTTQQKVVHMQRMVRRFHNLFINWYDELLPDEWNNSMLSREEYLERVFNPLEKDFEQVEASIQPSACFVVSIATVGSASYLFDCQLPVSLEDLFTLTHQNLLAIVSGMIKKTSLGTMELPPLVQKVIAHGETDPEIIQGNVQRFRDHLVGITISKKEIIYTINIPMHHHSAIVKIIYDKTNKTMETKWTFFGVIVTRWKMLHSFVSLIALLQDVQFKTKPTIITKSISKEMDDFWIDQAEVSFGWHITEQTDIVKVGKVNKTIIGLACGECYGLVPALGEGMDGKMLRAKLEAMNYKPSDYEFLDLPEISQWCAWQDSNLRPTD
ncbi:hypothetical protein HOM50_05120 [bacterium]|jgi:hypothetical protein|nr:hypothetical protein [bacterium]MBT5015762.1 hypothetical protein [bacterium]